MDSTARSESTLLRDLLTDRRRELLEDIEAARLGRPSSVGPGSGEVGDRKDDADQRQFDSLDEAMERRDRDELEDVEAALRRLDDGSFGDCRDCGEPIPLQRLRVQPAAQRCAACQLRFERTAPASR